MRDVAIVSYAQQITPKSDLDEVEMLVPVLHDALARAGLKKTDIGFTVSASCDYLGGRPFSFVMALDAVGAWPPIAESHVEMDGAWALYEAWVRLQHGDIDAACVYAFGKPSQGDLRDVLVTQLDPYLMAPLGADYVSLAALQARAMIDAGTCTERDLADIVGKRRGGRGGFSLDAHARGPYVASPLRPGDCAPSADGVAAAILVAGDRAKKCCAHPAWIRGIDHRIEAHAIGSRDLTKSRSTEIAGEKAGVRARSEIRRSGGGGGKTNGAARPIDVAEIHTPFSHEEILVKNALGLGADVDINPAGGPLAGHPFIVAGLARIGDAASRIHHGDARVAVAHATSGPCLQQNLVCLLEGA